MTVTLSRARIAGCWLRVSLCAVIVSSCLSASSCLPVWAESASPVQETAEIWPRSYVDGMTRKLGRGLANILTAPLELIRVPSLTGQREGGFSMLTVGVLQGFRAAGMREAAGIVEVLTFVTPHPRGFLPLVKPEFVYANGAWAP